MTSLDGMHDRSRPGARRPEPGLDQVMGERRRLLNLAYRLLGSLADAEDAVQETYTRWYALPTEQREVIDKPAAWLTTVAGRVCLDLLGSARARRERYVGQWVPEPLPEPTEWVGGSLRAGASADPADRVTLDESVTMAFLVVLDAMTPAERVAFMLHDVFRYPFTEVADVVGRSPAACRQLASSARRRIRTERTAATPAPEAAGVVRAFRRAWEAGDIQGLIAVLSPDATAIGDGGGRVTALPEPLTGAQRIAAFYVDRTPEGFQLLERTVNGQPGLVVLSHGTTVMVAAFDVVKGRIRHIWAVLNPDKLHSWA